MWPGSSVFGLYFSHPESYYFDVGKIECDQVEDYAERKGWSTTETERRLAPVLNYIPSSDAMPSLVPDAPVPAPANDVAEGTWLRTRPATIARCICNTAPRRRGRVIAAFDTNLPNFGVHRTGSNSILTASS
jgi:hypothetical protein